MEEFKDPYTVKGVWFFAIFIACFLPYTIWATKKGLSWDDTVAFNVIISSIFGFILPIWLLGWGWWKAVLFLSFIIANAVAIVLGGGFRQYRRLWLFLIKHFDNKTDHEKRD